ncbi:MAG: amidohydrolase family protein [Eubacteriales bacterium]
MSYKNLSFSEEDFNAAQILRTFLPGKIFDAHAHFYEASHIPFANSIPNGAFSRPKADMDTYRADLRNIIPETTVLKANMIPMPDPTMTDPATGNRDAANLYMVQQLEKNPGNVAELYILAGDTTGDLESMLVHPGICGFKCYYYAAPGYHANTGIAEFLPESAWQVANDLHLVITLHLMKDRSLADPENLAYIQVMAEKYPHATVILAHCARSFAAWTALESVRLLARFPNVWYDFSAICEAAPIFECIKRAGVKKVMWGSDYPIGLIRGKAISLSDGFYWIQKNDLEKMSPNHTLHTNLIIVENLLAVRQACDMLDLASSDVEDIFYNNACRLFG